MIDLSEYQSVSFGPPYGFRLTMLYHGSRDRFKKVLIPSLAQEIDERREKWFTWQPSEPGATLLFDKFVDSDMPWSESGSVQTIWNVSFARQDFGIVANLSLYDGPSKCTVVVLDISDEFEPFPIRPWIEEFADELASRFPVDFEFLEHRTDLTTMEFYSLPPPQSEAGEPAESQRTAEPTPTQATEPPLKPAVPSPRPAKPPVKPAEPSPRPAKPPVKPAEPSPRPAEPQQDSPMDQWFDWYHDCDKGGFKVTLREIAEKVGYSEPWIKELHRRYKRKRGIA